MSRKKTAKLKMPLGLKILLGFTSAFIMFSLFTPLIFPVDLGAIDLKNRLAMPSIFGLSDSGHLLGTDYLGRDFGIRLLYATRTSFILCLIGLAGSSVVGIVLGILSGMCGGIVDDFVTFLISIRQSVPSILIGIIIATIFGSSFGSIILVTILIQWTKPCKQTRTAIRQMKNEAFIECSRAIGASPLRIIREHMLRNIASPLIVTITLSTGSIILYESTLSYLSLGIQPPDTSLGVMVSAGRQQLIGQWWQAIIPISVIVLIVLAVSLYGDYLLKKIDPKLRER